MASDVLTKNWQTTSVLMRVEAKLFSITGSQFHSRTPLKPLSTLKYYSDLFMSLCRIPVADTLKNCGNYDNQRHQGNTTLKFTDKLLADFLRHIYETPLFYLSQLICVSCCTSVTHLITSTSSL